MPFFSPDGKWLGFSAEGKLKKVRLDGSGSPPVELPGTPNNRGASWGPEDTIVFSIGTGLMRIAADGGSPEPLTNIDTGNGEFNHYWPQVLPNGKGVIFSIVTGADYDDSSIVVQSFETGERRFLLNASYARHVPTGHLIYGREDTLYAVRFDLDRMEISGNAVPIQTAVSVSSSGPGSAHFAVSRNGTLIYVPRHRAEGRLFLVDLHGKAEPLAAPPRPYYRARFSPDGSRIAVTTETPGAAVEVHMYELEHERLSLVASEFECAGKIFKPADGLTWSADGQSLAVNAIGARESQNLYTIAVDGSGEARRLTEGFGYQYPDDWSKDENRLIFTDSTRPVGHSWGIFELDLRTGSSRELVNPRERQAQPALSPNGRWLAYISTESGRSEVYITPYPEPRGKLKVSTEGGRAPLWSPDGRRLYFLSGTA
jgi:Tol biopolymer transport system component